MIPIPPPDWLTACAERLRERWQTVTAEQLVDTAVDLWGDPELRTKSPQHAADLWLEKGGLGPKH